MNSLLQSLSALAMLSTVRVGRNFLRSLDVDSLARP
jgi:hypothetical protein